MHRSNHIVGPVRSIVSFLHGHRFLPVRCLPAFWPARVINCRCIARVNQLGIALNGTLRSCAYISLFSMMPCSRWVVEIYLSAGGTFLPARSCYYGPRIGIIKGPVPLGPSLSPLSPSAADPTFHNRDHGRVIPETQVSAGLRSLSLRSELLAC